MRQMTVVCDVCGIATRHEPPRVHWESEQDWITVTLAGNEHGHALDVCPRCQYIIRRAVGYTEMIAEINKLGERHG